MKTFVYRPCQLKKNIKARSKHLLAKTIFSKTQRLNSCARIGTAMHNNIISNVHVFFVSWFSASHGQPNWSSKFQSFPQYLEDLDIMLKHVDTYLRDFNIMLNHTWEAASMFQSAMPPGSSWSGEDCQHRSWKLYALRCQWQVLYASYTGVAPGPKKITMASPHLVYKQSTHTTPRNVSKWYSANVLFLYFMCAVCSCLFCLE